MYQRNRAPYWREHNLAAQIARAGSRRIQSHPDIFNLAQAVGRDRAGPPLHDDRAGTVHFAQRGEMQERSEDGSWRTNPQKGMSCKNNGPPQMRRPGRFFRDVSPVCAKFLIIRGAVSDVGRFSRTLPHACYSISWDPSRLGCHEPIDLT